MKVFRIVLAAAAIPFLHIWGSRVQLAHPVDTAMMARQRSEAEKNYRRGVQAEISLLG